MGQDIKYMLVRESEQPHSVPNTTLGHNLFEVLNPYYHDGALSKLSLTAAVLAEQLVQYLIYS